MRGKELFQSLCKDWKTLEKKKKQRELDRNIFNQIGWPSATEKTSKIDYKYPELCRLGNRVTQT